MHEYSLVQALLKQVDELQRRHAADRVVSIQVSVGEFSGVEPDLFRSAYEILIEQTPLSETELQMKCEPLQSHCEACGNDFAIEGFRFECTKCNSHNVTIVSGEGLLLESVTLEHAEPPLADQAIR